MSRILVTGGAGQVGQELQFLADLYPGFDFIFTDVAELDITDSASVQAFFAQQPLDYCINCAAYTAVDKAESDLAPATRINVDGPRHLAEACAQAGIPFLQLSTDYVYHNQQNTPFKEGDPTSPQGVYAATKLDGDLAALAAHPAGAMVIRTSWVYSSFGHNFVKTMLRLGKERDQLRVVFDQIGTPTYARDLAVAMLDILQQAEQTPELKQQLKGVYHYSNEGVCSWYDFALAIFELCDIHCRVAPIESSEYPTPAARPPFSVLNKAKIKQTFGLEIPHWRESLLACLVELGEIGYE